MVPHSALLKRDSWKVVRVWWCAPTGPLSELPRDILNLIRKKTIELPEENKHFFQGLMPAFFSETKSIYDLEDMLLLDGLTGLLTAMGGTSVVYAEPLLVDVFGKVDLLNFCLNDEDSCICIVDLVEGTLVALSDAGHLGVPLVQKWKHKIYDLMVGLLENNPSRNIQQSVWAGFGSLAEACGTTGMPSPTKLFPYIARAITPVNDDVVRNNALWSFAQIIEFSFPGKHKTVPPAIPMVLLREAVLIAVEICVLKKARYSLFQQSCWQFLDRATTLCSEFVAQQIRPTEKIMELAAASLDQEPHEARARNALLWTIARHTPDLCPALKQRFPKSFASYDPSPEYCFL